MRFPPREPVSLSPPKIYYLSPEELAQVHQKYGPPRQRPERNQISHDRVCRAIMVSEGPEESAKLLRVTVVELKQYIKKYNIQPIYGRYLRESNNEEEGIEKMLNTKLAESPAGGVLPAVSPTLPEAVLDRGKSEVHANLSIGKKTSGGEMPVLALKDLESPESKHGGGVTESVPLKKLTREWLAIELGKRDIQEIRKDFPNVNVMAFAVRWGLIQRRNTAEVLSKEKLMQLKGQGKSDREIVKEYGLSFRDYYEVKKRYGIDGTQVNGSSHDVRQKVTLARAFELRIELEEDTACIDRIMGVVEKGAEITGRVLKLLSDYRDKCQQRLEHIYQVFQSTEVEV